MNKQRAQQLYKLADSLSKVDVTTLSEQQVQERNTMIARLSEEAKKMKEGYTVTRGIDKERYQERDGLEGPFSTKSGKTVYYDKVEGKYYDPDTDMYIEYADWQAMNEQGVAEGDYNPDTFVGKKGTYKGYGITQEGPHQWGISSSSRKFTTLNAAKQHIDKNLIDGVTEAKGLKKRVRVVKTGQTGTIGEVRHGLYKGAPKTFTVDLDDGSSIQLPKEAIRLIKDQSQGVAEGDQSDSARNRRAAQAHEQNLDSAHKELRSRDAEGEDMSDYRVNPRTYKIEKKVAPALIKKWTPEEQRAHMIDRMRNESAVTTMSPSGERPFKPNMEAPKKKYPAIGTVAFEQLPKHTQEELRKRRGHTKGVAESGYEDEYDHSNELNSGDYVRDSSNPDGEIFVMVGDPSERRVRIEDRDGRGWNISPSRLTPVAEDDPEIARYFGDELDEGWKKEHSSSMTKVNRSRFGKKVNTPNGFGTIHIERKEPTFSQMVPYSHHITVKHDDGITTTYPAHAVKLVKESELEEGSVASDQQGVAEADNPEYDDEAGMSHNSLHTIRRAVDGLEKTIKQGDNLPEWVQAKLSIAEEDLVTIWDYLQSEQEGQVEESKKPSPKLSPVNIKKTAPVSEEINNEAYKRLHKVFAFKNYKG